MLLHTCPLFSSDKVGNHSIKAGSQTKATAGTEVERREAERVRNEGLLERDFKQKNTIAVHVQHNM